MQTVIINNNNRLIFFFFPLKHYIIFMFLTKREKMLSIHIIRYKWSRKKSPVFTRVVYRILIKMY